MLTKLGNYKLFLFSNSILALAMGIFAPFWIIFIQNFGSIEQFGFAVGLTVLAQSITSYFFGKHSDRLGRKIFLIAGGLVISVVIIAYTLIDSLTQLYILQIIYGIAASSYSTMETVFLGDVTKKSRRGADIGKYQAIIGIIAALAIMSGGFLVGRAGFKIIFYVTAALIFISTLLLLYIKE